MAQSAKTREMQMQLVLEACCEFILPNFSAITVEG
jgi:hypothetical protein